MDKQMIEKMAKVSGGCDYPHRPCEKCWCKEKGECGAYAYAQSFYEKGYRKIPEGGVVISKEQNENWLSFLEQNIEKARKEAVEKFVELLLSEYAAFEEEDEILIKDMRGDIQDVAKALIGGEYAERTI